MKREDVDHLEKIYGRKLTAGALVVAFEVLGEIQQDPQLNHYDEKVILGKLYISIAHRMLDCRLRIKDPE